MHLKNSFLEDCEVEIQVLNIYFSDPNLLEVKISKKRHCFYDFLIEDDKNCNSSREFS